MLFPHTLDKFLSKTFQTHIASSKKDAEPFFSVEFEQGTDVEHYRKQKRHALWPLFATTTAGDIMFTAAQLPSTAVTCFPARSALVPIFDRMPREVHDTAAGHLKPCTTTKHAFIMRPTPCKEFCARLETRCHLAACFSMSEFMAVTKSSARSWNKTLERFAQEARTLAQATQNSIIKTLSAASCLRDPIAATRAGELNAIHGIRGKS